MLEALRVRITSLFPTEASAILIGLTQVNTLADNLSVLGLALLSLFNLVRLDLGVAID